MRLTLNIDGDLLERVVNQLGVKTKTEAIHHALQEIDRRHALKQILKEGSGVPAEELPFIFDPASIAEHLPENLSVAEPRSPYGTSET